jgi:urease accessory protein UreF
MSQGVAFIPTEEHRRTVKAMAGLGVPHEGIAVLLEIDPKTLRKYFDAELERGSVEATAKVAQSLFQMATAGKNVAATIFWMKARAGWREKHEVQVTTGIDLTQLTDEQLEQMVGEGFEKWQEARARPLAVIDGTFEGE